MNKERDLLKEIMIYLAKGDITIRKFENSGDIAETFHSVQELLAQPEQTEPVAWIIQTEVEGKLLEWVCTDKKHYMEEHDSIKEPIPLYLAPKREQGLREDLREGISFCDHFAGLAMQGLLNGVDNYTMSTKATWAYNMADAMLMERSKRDEQR
jgi:hypothetical protein